jgi:serine/threonine protein kinase
MGIVYQGLQPIIQKRVAIKVLRPAVARDVVNTERLVAEAKAVNAIRHRNIIDIFSLGTLPDGRAYVVMEYLDGRPLDSVLSSVGAFAETEAVGFLLELCNPLQAAHRAGVVHRDLKPGNIFVCQQDDGARYLKLLDFGLARRPTEGELAGRKKGTIMGTPGYMSPEQALGQAITAKTDVYALGVLAFELVTGRLPFNGATPWDVAMAHASTPPPELQRVAPSVSAGFSSLVQRMLAKDPEERASLEEVRASLVALRPELQSSTAQLLPSLNLSSSPGLSLAKAASLTATAVMKARHALTPNRVFAVGLAAVGALSVGGWYVAASSAQAERQQATTAPVADTETPALASTPASTPATVAPPAVASDSAAPAGEASTAADAPTSTPPPAPLATAPLDVAPESTPSPPPEAPAPQVSPPPRKPAPPARRVPSAAELRARVERLEARLRAAVPPGEAADPTALKLLQSKRLQAEMASTVAQRTQLARQLDAWERSFLSP